MKKSLFSIILLLLFTACIGRQLVKTGTLADRKINPTYFLKNLEVKTAKGETVKVILVSDGSSYITKKGKYISKPSMSIIETFQHETIGEEKKKSSITGNEKMVPVLKKTSKGFVADYSFQLTNKKYIPELYKVKLNLLNAKGDFETIDDHIFTEKEKDYMTLSTIFKGKSPVFIPTGHFLQGDRKFLYIYQIVLEDASGKVLENLNSYSLLWYHEVNYNYIQGYNSN